MSYDIPVERMLKTICGRVSFHMPGHMGLGALPLGYDTTEFALSCDLHANEGAYREAQRLAADAMGAPDVRFLTGGGTQGVQAMLLAAVPRGGTVIMPRDAHLSAYHACALFGLNPTFVYPEPDAVSGLYTTREDDLISGLDSAPESAAMLVVSPDYYGRMLDLDRLYRACSRKGARLLVDAAHGAHLPFMGEKLCGDIIAMSAHKTLPALTMGAFLAITDRDMTARVDRALRMLATSSPSSLICLSLDRARAAMCDARLIQRFMANIDAFWRECPYPNAHDGFSARCDRARLVIDVSGSGMTGYAVKDYLQGEGIDMEMADERRIVGIPSVATPDGHFPLLARSLAQMPRKASCVAETGRYMSGHVPILPAKAAMPLCEAALAQSEPVLLNDAAGRVSAVCAGLYPPGVPLIAPGEVIPQDIISALSNNAAAGVSLFGVNDSRIQVVKERFNAL